MICIFSCLSRTAKILVETLATFQNWTFFSPKNVHFQNVGLNLSQKKYYSKRLLNYFPKIRPLSREITFFREGSILPKFHEKNGTFFENRTFFENVHFF